MQQVRSGQRPWTLLYDLHRESLEELLPKFGLTRLAPDDLDHINRVWHRSDAWPDAIAGLTRLKSKYVIGPLSNGNISLLANMAKYAGLPWDLSFSTELFKAYKPMPAAYLGVAQAMNVKPSEVMLCAAHNDDLKAARAQGLKTAFWPRPTEYGSAQTKDFKAEESWDLVATDIRDLADQLLD